MRGWYLLDEGGRSGPGNWSKVRTSWNKDVAMPHGWAIAELWLLLRDSLVHEDGDKLVLLTGVDPQWFNDVRGVHVRRSAHALWVLSFSYRPKRWSTRTQSRGFGRTSRRLCPGVVAQEAAARRSRRKSDRTCRGRSRCSCRQAQKGVMIEFTELVKKPTAERK